MFFDLIVIDLSCPGCGHCHPGSVMSRLSHMTLTLVSMSVSSSAGPRTSISMRWPHTRPIWSSSFSRSTQSAMLFNSFPSRSQVNKCCGRDKMKHQTWRDLERVILIEVMWQMIPPLCTEICPSCCLLTLHTPASALLKNKPELRIIHQTPLTLD